MFDLITQTENFDLIKAHAVISIPILDLKREPVNLDRLIQLHVRFDYRLALECWLVKLPPPQKLLWIFRSFAPQRNSVRREQIIFDSTLFK